MKVHLLIEPIGFNKLNYYDENKKAAPMVGDNRNPPAGSNRGSPYGGLSSCNAELIPEKVMPPPTSIMETGDKEANTIKLRIIKKSPHGLGFYLRNDKESAVISGLVPGCDAEKSKLVYVGDRIGSVNGISVENMNFDQVLGILGRIPIDSPVLLLLKGPPNCRTRLETTFGADGTPVTKRFTEALNYDGNAAGLNGNTDHVEKKQNGAGTEEVTKHLEELNEKLQQRLSRIEDYIVANLGSRHSSRRTSRVDRSIIRSTSPSIHIPSQTGDLIEETLVKAAAINKNQLAPSSSPVRTERRHSHADGEAIKDANWSRNQSINRKYVKLRNVVDGATASDTLHRQASESVGCAMNKCLGSLMNTVKPASTAWKSAEETMPLAKDFIKQYYESIKRLNTPAHEARWSEVESQIRSTGTYELKEQELTYAAKLAWRNSQRCIGRIQWSKLQVFDARFISTPRSMFDALLNHIKYATNKGNLRSAITIFRQRIGTAEQDFRIWNAQLIRYAGYKQEDGSIIGDPASAEFTEICQSLGWKGQGGPFDILPLVLSANGQDPEYFEIPKEVILQVKLTHPENSKFGEMNLQWYGLPAVSGMNFEVGGITFPACAFSGWYMQTEIARDLCDANRYNLIEEIAGCFGFDTAKVSSLWKDQTYLEVNRAILYSFQNANVTIVDHHSASDSFMRHLENEQRLRGGCPADWVWIVPPLGGSLLSVFHQEMLNYRLSPSYDYQDDAWKSHIWKKDRNHKMNRHSMKRKFGFREIARAVKFSAKLMAKALARRIRATIIYATETGRSERYARTLYDVFKYGFDVNVTCAENYDFTHMEHEALLLVVTSTFGNGDPPDNGKGLAQYLRELGGGGSSEQKQGYVREDSAGSTDSAMSRQDTFMDVAGPLSNIRYAVFGLGSSAYPHFCAFARYVDKSLKELGGECILPIHTGDELNGQDQAFQRWASEVFKSACDVFCLGDDVNMMDAQAALSQGDSSWSKGKYRIRVVNEPPKEDLPAALSKLHNKRIEPLNYVARKQLQNKDSARQTILASFECLDGMEYQPGDHLAICAANHPDMVMKLIAKLSMNISPKSVTVVEVMEEKSVGLLTAKSWAQSDRLPVATLETVFGYFLDITSPPSQMFLNQLAELALDEPEQKRLKTLAEDTSEYEAWKKFNWPNLLEVLDEFPSIEVDPTLLLAELPLLQPRFYSISSSPDFAPQRVDCTVGIVSYKTRGGQGPIHHGVASAYLNTTRLPERIPCYIRSAPSFHLPENLNVPIYLIGAGTGIAPFRSFWQQFLLLRQRDQNAKFELHLLFGCRSMHLDHIYKDEIDELCRSGILRSFHLALSREVGVPKTYVQHLIPSIGKELVVNIQKKEGHVYVCGDVGMAAGVYEAVKRVCVDRGLTETQATTFLNAMRSSGRYHEDIFGNYTMASGY